MHFSIVGKVSLGNDRFSYCSQQCSGQSCRLSVSGHRIALWSEAFLSGVSMLSLRTFGFSLGTLISSHRPGTCMSSYFVTLKCPQVWLRVRVVVCLSPCDGLATLSMVCPASHRVTAGNRHPFLLIQKGKTCKKFRRL